MGNCCQAKPSGNLQTRLMKLIDSNSSEQLLVLVQHNKQCLDTRVAKVDHIYLSPLAYSVYIGASKSFQILFKQNKHSFHTLHSEYSAIGKTPLQVICELGHLQLLQVFLPIWLEKHSSPNEKPLPTDQQIVVSPMTSIQRACDRSKIELVKFLITYFQRTEAPNELNVHYIEETTGENCALVACRTGNAAFIQYLHTQADANFHVLNKRKESAIQLAAAWSKKRRNVNYLDSIQYLVEVVQVDFVYEYEETLLVLEDKRIIQYLEMKLEHRGITACKSDIDKRFALQRPNIPIEPTLDKKLSTAEGTNFQFAELFKEELEDSGISVSSIYPLMSKSVSYIHSDFSRFLRNSSNLQ